MGGIICGVAEPTPTAGAHHARLRFIHVRTSHASELSTREAKTRELAIFKKFDLFLLHIGKFLVTLLSDQLKTALHMCHTLRLIL